MQATECNLEQAPGPITLKLTRQRFKSWYSWISNRTFTRNFSQKHEKMLPTIKIPIGVTRNPRPKRGKSQMLCVQETLQEVTVDSEPNEATNRQDYSQISASEGVLSFSGSTTLTVIQPFTSNHRPRELWEIPNQRQNWIEVFTRHVQIDTCRSGSQNRYMGPPSTTTIPSQLTYTSPLPSGLPKHLMSRQRPTIGQMISGATPTFWTTAQVS